MILRKACPAIAALVLACAARAAPLELELRAVRDAALRGDAKAVDAARARFAEKQLIGMLIWVLPAAR